MNYELIKEEFIKSKKEELDYIDSITKISSNKILSEYEKLEIYRTLKNYEIKLNEICDRLYKEAIKNIELKKDNLKNVILEFNLDKNYLSSINLCYEQHKEKLLECLGIDSETFKFKLTLYDLIYNTHEYIENFYHIIQNNQKLIENPIYVFCGYHDSSEKYCIPCFGGPDDYIYGIYKNICDRHNMVKEIPEKDILNFEKDKMIIRSKGYVGTFEIKQIFEEELLNIHNRTLNDCFIETKNRVEKLEYTRSPEYKEKILLNKINELYKKIEGKFIKKEVLYNGDFLDILRETYKLPNGNIIQKEKVVKNSGKNSVIVISITQDKEYIITFQNRIKNKIIAEFPSGYIENDEGPIDAAKRELKEETGYATDDLFIVDECYTSPGIDNSVTYIVIANNCIKTDNKDVNGTELIDYGLFSDIELNYLINNNIMNGAMNKLAYYNLVNNVDNCNCTYVKCKEKIYKKQEN